MKRSKWLHLMPLLSFSGFYFQGSVPLKVNLLIMFSLWLHAFSFRGLRFVLLFWACGIVFSYLREIAIYRFVGLYSYGDLFELPGGIPLFMVVYRTNLLYLSSIFSEIVMNRTFFSGHISSRLYLAYIGFLIFFSLFLHSTLEGSGLILIPENLSSPVFLFFEYLSAGLFFMFLFQVIVLAPWGAGKKMVGFIIASPFVIGIHSLILVLLIRFRAFF